MSEERREQGQRNRTVLGADCRISGELCLENDAVLMGRFEGVLRVAGTLELAATAHIKGTIIASTIQLAGQAEGDLIAEEGIDLLSGAQLAGDLFAPRLNIEDGAVFQGQVCVSPNAMDLAAERLEGAQGQASDHEAAAQPAPAEASAPVQPEPERESAEVELASESAAEEDADSPVRTVAHSVSAAIEQRRAKVLSSARRVATAVNSHA